MELLLIFAAIIVIVIIFSVGKAKTNTEIEEKIVHVKKNYVYEEKKYVPSEDEKKSIFDRYYAEFKDFDISTLDFIIETGKKSSYHDYTEDDKMKFKAQKTLIEEKRKVEQTRRIQKQLQNVKSNINLVEYMKKDYCPVNEIDNIVRSINFNLLNTSGESRINNFLELKNNMSTKQFYEIVLRGCHCDDIEEISFNYKCLSDGNFEIERKYKENGSEYNSIWTGGIISKQDVDFDNAYKKEKVDLTESVKLYSKIIESESTPMITYINASERISIILGKQKMYETDYFFLSNIYNIIRESSKNNDFGFFNPTIISKRLEKAENKIKK